jgi:hypothetical protein
LRGGPGQLVNSDEELRQAQAAMDAGMSACSHSDSEAKAQLAAMSVAGGSFTEMAVTPDDVAVSWSGSSTHPPNVTPAGVGPVVGHVVDLSQS